MARFFKFKIVFLFIKVVIIQSFIYIRCFYVHILRLGNCVKPTHLSEFRQYLRNGKADPKSLQDSVLSFRISPNYFIFCKLLTHSIFEQEIKQIRRYKAKFIHKNKRSQSSLAHVFLSCVRVNSNSLLKSCSPKQVCRASYILCTFKTRFKLFVYTKKPFGTIR